MRILITGAPGSGTSTLGRRLSERLGIAFFDDDDYYWLPTDPPFRQKRALSAGANLLLTDLANVPDAVVSGSIMRWGLQLADSFSFIAFLIVDVKVRIARLRERDIARFGRVDPDFLEWAAQYDEGRMDGRSRARHEQWLAARTCPILRIEDDPPLAASVDRVISALSDHRLQAAGVMPRAPQPGG